ncbi:MAG: LLM class F420-dependent oxidoreductase [Nitriliruptorales bacterium]
MRVGAFLAPWGPLADRELCERFAIAAEAAGFASLWTGDHVVFPHETASRYAYNEGGSSPFGPDQPHLEPIVLLTHLAARTARIRLGISVLILAMRNPVLAAKMLGDLQTLSRGRVTLGVGAGWLREEFEALGADFDRRGPATDEYVGILRHLWDGRREPFEGEHYSFGSIGFSPRPAPIPVLVGGNSEAALRRAVRVGDGWHPLRLEPDAVREHVARLRGLAEAGGRSPDDLTVVHRGRLFDLDTTRAGPGDDQTRADRLRQRLAAYEEAGVEEFVLEFPYPGSPPDRQLAWLDWFGEYGLTGTVATTATEAATRTT